MKYLSAFSVIIGLAIMACGESGQPQPDQFVNPYPDFMPSYPDQSTVCSAVSCSGCCKGNICVSGITTDACGYGGLTCQQCKTGEKCVAGVCTLDKCDATNCPKGCCDANKQCQNGTSDSACGSAGGSCTVCKTAESCVSGTCTPKSSGLYKVVLVSLTKISSYDCGLWDTCDFYVELEVGNAKATSSVKADTNSPVWNEQMLNSQLSEITKKFYAKVYEDDWPFDTYVGECKTTVTSTDVGKGTLTVDCGTYSYMGFTKSCSVNFKFEAVK